MKKSMLLIIALCLFSQFSWAASSGSFTIKSLGISNTSRTLYVTINETIKDTVCGSEKTLRVVLDDTSESLFNTIYSTALTAKVTGSPVNIGYMTESCHGSNMLLNYITIK